MSNAARVVTASELERYPSDDQRYELVRGRVVRMSPVGYLHGAVVMRLGFLLSRHLEGRRLGAVLTEVGFTLARDPDTVRAPDISFVCQARIPASQRGFFNGSPDLAIEVLSPDDRATELQEKIMEYLARGTNLVVVVDPEQQAVALYRSGASAEHVTGADSVLDLSDVISGFTCRLGEIFE